MAVSQSAGTVGGGGLWCERKVVVKCQGGGGVVMGGVVVGW